MAAVTNPPGARAATTNAAEPAREPQLFRFGLRQVFLFVSGLAALLGASSRTLARDVEPHLFRMGLVTMTPQGRTALHRPRILGAAAM